DGRDRLSARYAFYQNVQDKYVLSLYPDLDEPLILRGQNLSLNYTRELGGGTNELKFGFNRNSVQVLRPHPEFPTFSSGDGISLPGSESAYDYFFRDTVFHLLDNYSRLRGGHAMIFGFEWRPYVHDSHLSAARDGRYLFGSVFDFLADQPFVLQIAINRQTRLPAEDADFRRYYFQNELAAFFQDNWKLTRRFTLNLGLRYEYFGAPSARNNTQDYNFAFGPGSNIVERIASGKMATGQLFRPDRNNIAPRFGFAFDLAGNGRSVLRGGYGIYFDRIFNNFWMDTRSNNLTFRTFQNLFGAAQFQYTIPARNAVAPVAVLAPSFDVAVDQGLRTPYSQSWFIGWQQQLTENLILEVNQTGSIGRKLAATDVINRLFSLPTSVENPQGRFNPSEPNISYRSNQGHSDHIAIQVALNRRLSRGTEFQISYTLGRTRDVQSDPLGRKAGGSSSDQRKRLSEVSLFDQPDVAFVRQFDQSADYGYSDFDQKHNLVFNLTAQIPQGMGFPPAFSGWQASAIAGFRSGFPFTVTSSLPAISGPNDPFGILGFFVEPGRGILQNNRADYHGKSLSEAFLVQPVEIPGGMILLDSVKFASPPSNRLGYSSRNSLFGPGFWNVDLSLSRRFLLPRVGEQVSVQFRAEFFNVFNHTNLGNPFAKLNSLQAPFGQALFGRDGVGSSSPGASPLNEQPRRIQFALKVNF
ncbi:MAG: TonB-dependent receptor, partial [Acidobacteria bacterium]|nr:TonB-dependent receptor [Acidobacteriota bacterium]